MARIRPQLEYAAVSCQFKEYSEEQGGFYRIYET